MKKLTTFMGLPTTAKTTNVTIPSITEIPRHFSYRLNDFAMFSGAIPQQTQSLQAKDPVPFGAIWTTSLFDHREVFAMTVDNVFSYLPVRRPTFPHAKYVAVAPRFVNPEAKGLGTYFYHGDEYLTLKGELVYYPQTMVPPYQIQKVKDALVHGKMPTINNLPYQEYAEDHQGTENSPLTNPYTNYGNFYRYQKQNYALYSCYNPTTKQFQYYWFYCEPIKVQRDVAHNAIQCLNPLFAASYEPYLNPTSLVQYLNDEDRTRFVDHVRQGEIPSCRFYRLDPNYTQLGQYLNTGFMNQLAMSTNFDKIDQLQHQTANQVSQDNGFEM